MKCYYSFRQYEDHLNTIEATNREPVSLAVSFPNNCIFYWWQQQKDEIERNSIVALSWDKFKAFLLTNLEESTAFINTVWEKMCSNSQYWQEKTQDWMAYLRYLSSIAQKLNFACIVNKSQQRRNIYIALRLLIKP